MAVSVEHANIGTAAPAGSAASIPFTTNQNVSAGACIVIYAYFWNGSGTFTGASNTGSSSLTWNIAVQGRSGGPTFPTPGILYAMAPSGLNSGAVITVALSASFGARGAGGAALLDVDPNDPLGNVSTVTGSGTANVNWTTSSVSIEAGSALVGVAGAEGAGGTHNTSYTPLIATTHGGGGGTESVAMVARIEASAASYNVGGTWTNAVQHNRLAAEFRAAPPAGPTQALRPDADLATSGWSTAPLFDDINDDSDSTLVTGTLA